MPRPLSPRSKEALRGLVALEDAFEVDALPAARRARASQTTADPAARLAELAHTAEQCTACPLHRTRTRLVFGTGHARARLMFIGEAPGREEDLQGKPFVGAAGQLLTKIIESIGLARDEVYIANILKDRPPGNRQPEPTEVAACFHWLEEQIAIIQPQVLCTLGRHAAMALVDPAIAIMRTRGTWKEWRGIPLMPTLHPAYLLRNPDAKKLVWKDLKAVRDRLKTLA